MKKYKILSAQKRRLLSRVSTLEGTRDKAQNKIYELDKLIKDKKLYIKKIKTLLLQEYKTKVIKQK